MTASTRTSGFEEVSSRPGNRHSPVLRAFVAIVLVFFVAYRWKPVYQSGNRTSTDSPFNASLNACRL